MRRWIPIALLFALTLGLGAAARLASPAGPAHGGGSAHATRGDVGLELHLDRSSVLQGGDGLVRAELVLRGRDAQGIAPVRSASDLLVVLDRSGSMQGQPLATALGAARELIAQLADGDRFALVSYASGAAVEIDFEAASPASRARWLARLERIAASGGTDLASGLDRAHGLLDAARRSGRAARVIVLSDGLANQGDYSLDGLRRRAGRAVAGEYVLSAVGIGDGFDETVMGALADAGTGNFYYLPDLSRLAGVFTREFEAARETVARALHVVLQPSEGVRVVGAGGYPLSHDGGAVSFRPGDLFAGQERRVWITLHAPTATAGAIALGALRVDFATPGGEPGRVSIDALPELACVEAADDYYASFDAEAYRRGNLSDSLGQLKQSVSRLVKEGRQSEAVAEVEAYRAEKSEESIQAFGAALPEELAELDALHDTVAAPSAAEPEARNRLGKKLLESGRDDQRAGAKK